MFGQSPQQQKQIESLQRRIRVLEGLVHHLAERTGMSEAELLQLRGEIGTQMPEECRRLIGEDKYIEAIKVYREKTGASLKEAKDAVDEYRAAQT